ncbi:MULTISPECIES: hypothetical protein [Clostridium]|uniref:hypothetical protein n=1 Tax=Clostridium pasteurianum TaxID=1501 RepID=UPI00082688BA|nr:MULTISPECIES: hypothetical protein [Clostridium]PJI06577.1 hypothetical protein CUB90_01265 [Clostridium sp. CT7]
MKRKFLAGLIAVALTTAVIGISKNENIAKADTNIANVGVSYSGHVQNIGWQTPVSDGQEAGTDGKGLRVEALKLNLTNAPKGAAIEYQAHVQNIGWQDWKQDGQEAGTDGKGLRVEALKIKLKNMPGYSIQYKAHVENVGWQDWVSDGQEAGTDGKGLRVEALEIRIVKTSDTTVGVNYSGHVQNIGWQNAVENGQIAGTEGQGLRVEALKLNLENAPADAHIKYQTHVQNIGWQTPVSDGQEGGTDGKSYRVEAIKIALEGMPGYSVQYRAHVQNIGWQNWVSDGQEAGTDGKGLRVEAIEVRIVLTGHDTTPVDFIPVNNNPEPTPSQPKDDGDHAVLPTGINGGGYEYKGTPLNNYTLSNEVNDAIGKTKNPNVQFMDDHGNKGNTFEGINLDAQSVSTGEMTKDYMEKDIENSYKDNNGGLYTYNGKVYKLAGIYTESTKLDSNNADKLANAAKTLNTQFVSNADPQQTYDRVFVNYEGNTNEIVRIVTYFTPAN